MFHSFDQFNVLNGRSAYFTNPTGISNIFTRVTGGNLSSIDGTLGVSGAANLFLLNPNGILFGGNARLDVSGSFVASTADQIQFESGVFDATNLTAPLLTISVPLGLQFGSNPGMITNRSTVGLGTPSGSTIALIGGDLAIVGGRIITDGSVELASFTPNSSVNLIPNGTGYRINASSTASFQDIRLTQRALVQSQGNLSLQGRNISLEESSQLQTISTANPGGNLTIQATGIFSLSDTINRRARISTIVPTGATGKGGDITIQAGQVWMQDSADVYTMSEGSGASGAIAVQANRLEMIDRSYLYTEGYSTGRTGDIDISVGDLRLFDGAGIIAYAEGDSPAGNVTIRANQADLIGTATNPYTVIETTSYASSPGRGGDLTVNVAGRLQLLDGGRLQAGSLTARDSGTLTVRAGEIIADHGGFDQTGIKSRMEWGSSGQSAPVIVEAGRILVRDGAEIATATHSVAGSDAGSLTIKTDELTVFGGLNEYGQGGIFTKSTNGTGRGGDIRLEAGSLRLLDGGEVTTDAQDSGNAGNLTVKANTVQIEGIDAVRQLLSALRTSTSAGGNGGNVTIESDRLALLNGGRISASTTGAGQAGNVTLTVNDIALRGQSSTFTSQITASSNTGASSGSIQINSQRLVIADQAQISVSNTSTGKAGAIGINTSDLSLTSNGKLTAEVRDGDSGEIRIVSQRARLDDSMISTSTSGQGNGGLITLTARESLQLSNLAQLSSQTSDRGNAGNIQIQSPTIELQSAAAVTTATTGTGNAGTLNIQSEILSLRDLAQFSTASSAAGKAGNITVQSGAIALYNNAQISSRSTSSGEGGTIRVTGRSLDLSTESDITSATSAGNGGNLSFSLSELLLLRDRSHLNAEAGGSGDGGNIAIQAPFIIGLGNSDIIANANMGRGGNISITTQSLLGLQFRSQLTPDNDITASSQFGMNGSVQIELLAISPAQGLTEFALDILDPSQRLAQSCVSNQGSRFIITGRGGVPANPTEQVRSDRTWVDLRDFSGQGRTIAAATAVAPALIEATAWQRNPQTGKVELIADYPSVSTNPAASCAP
ncbi:putative hemagglutinin-related protein [Leptolyngbya sp. NIES-2104]|nr:putative hemagglutinin-related protein [Leptolyngbya sp. NIES-2104]